MMLNVVKLLKLDIENFRGIKNFVLTPDGHRITVQGANGTGKSTLMAAFLWLLTGKDAQGRENYNVFPLGTDGNRLSGCSPTVTATLSMPDGRTLILQRSICERWTKRRGSAETEYNGDETRYFIDEVPVSAGEYSSAIFGMFPEKLLPLLLNAAWFSEQTKDYKERRRLLLEQFGSLQPADVFTANPELSDLESMLGTHSVDEFSRICTERRKRYKDSLSALPARIDENRKQLQSMSDAGDIKNKRSKLNVEIAKLQYEIEHTTADAVQRHNQQELEKVRQYVIMSGAYLYVYENSDNEIVYTRFDSKQTVGIWDYSTPANLVGLVRMWKEEDDAGNPQSVIELLAQSGTRMFRSSSDGYKEETGDNGSTLWDGIPAVAFENPDNIAIFEPGLSDIKDFEQIRKNIRSMTQENDEAKLLLRGYSYENPATILNEQGEMVPNPARLVEERAILNARTISVDDDGDIHWLLKDVNYSGLLDVLKSLHDEITMLTGVPNMTDEAFANADNASALGYKLYALDQYTASMDRIFRKGYLALWELICGRLAKKGRKFDFRDIDVVMQRNIPTDKDKSINRAAAMKTSGLFSDETCISESQVEVDPAEEIAKRDAEAAANYELAVERAKELGDEDDTPGQDDGKTGEDGDLNGTARP